MSSEPTHLQSEPPWWRRAAIYQVYIRSFADGNGDGTGDISGLRARLPYLQSLGVDAIWVNPWYPSPLNDGGYDVADYRDINPLYGTLDEARTLIREARDRGIRLIVDLVPNHTSSDHAWFKEALASPPGSPARDRYVFKEGRGPDGAEPPTNWKSVFGGSTWTRIDDGQWYLHLFDPTQPDLNWANPEVRAEFRDILRFWLDLGASGFRVDVAHGLAKDPSFPDLDDDKEREFRGVEFDHPYWDRDEVHEIIREWRSVLDEYDGSMMVAEAWVANWDRLSRYLRPDEFHQAFDFEFLESPWDLAKVRDSIRHSIDGAATVGSIPTWVLSNHDVVRHATRYALPADVIAKEWLLDGDRSLLDHEVGLRRARAMTLVALALPGSCYLYQGEELGLPEVHDLTAEQLDDPVWRQSGGMEKGRDGCRVPLPWEPEGPSHGFGDGAPWLGQPDGWHAHAASAQDGSVGSTLEMYRDALAVRREQLTADEALRWIDAPDGVLAFARGSGIRCYVNMSEQGVSLPDGAVLVSSGPLEGDTLPPDTAAWIR